MPNQMRPEVDWVGTANHRIFKVDYAYKFSRNFASSWRYRRIKEFMEQREQLSAEDHWTLLNDIKNPMAEIVTPLYIEALRQDPQSTELATILQQWDFFDRADEVAPALFQVITKHFVRLTFSDDLDESLWDNFFDSIYVWQERFVMLLDDDPDKWFDVNGTEKIETRDEVLQLAIAAALQELCAELGEDHNKWSWGRLHTITFASPVIPGKTAAKWLGGGTRPMFGSSETLNRARYTLSEDYQTKIIDSVRLVADLADDEKVLAVIPGGTSARYFDKSLANQTDDWMAGKGNPIWFDEAKVDEHAVSELTLLP